MLVAIIAFHEEKQNGARSSAVSVYILEYIVTCNEMLLSSGNAANTIAARTVWWAGYSFPIVTYSIPSRICGISRESVIWIQ
jgi:hypothetical protein